MSTNMHVNAVMHAASKLSMSTPVLNAAKITSIIVIIANFNYKTTITQIINEWFRQKKSFAF